MPENPKLKQLESIAAEYKAEGFLSVYEDFDEDWDDLGCCYDELDALAEELKNSEADLDKSRDGEFEDERMFSIRCSNFSNDDDTYMYGGIEDMGAESVGDDDVSDEVAESQDAKDFADVQLEMVASIHDLMHDPEALHQQVIEGLKQTSLAPDSGKEPETSTIVNRGLGQGRNSHSAYNNGGQPFFMSGANAIPIGKRRRRVPAVESSPTDRQDPIASVVYPSLSESNSYNLLAFIDPFGRSAAEIEKRQREVNKELAETGQK
ncbi:MAG: hypothetical protein Q9187_000793 [Circinaria calcarea]